MRLLDLFCGEGGAGVGYERAGWCVIGVDLSPSAERRYPLPFVRADALDYLKRHGHRYDLVHASPPCQRYTHGNAANPEQAARHPDLIGPVRELLLTIGVPYIVENVPRSPLRDPLVLCGSMFNLTAVDLDGQTVHLRRHRHFESSLDLSAPRPCRHDRSQQIAGVYGGARSDKVEARTVRRGGYVPATSVQQQLMGVDWMTGAGLREAIPPAYTAHLGRQAAAALG